MKNLNSVWHASRHAAWCAARRSSYRNSWITPILSTVRNSIISKSVLCNSVRSTAGAVRLDLRVFS